MRTKLARSAGLLLGALVVVALLAPPALAHRFRANTKITIDYDGTNFFGTVTSKKEPSCEAGRTVTVIRRQPGADLVVGSDTTDAQGNWLVPAPGAQGNYYAVVDERSEGGYGHSHVCKGARSRTLGSGVLGGGGGGGDVAGGGGDVAGGGGLPFTGTQAALFTGIALALIGTGTVLVRRTRHKSSNTA
jgi:hypothetical protein